MILISYAFPLKLTAPPCGFHASQKIHESSLSTGKIRPSSHQWWVCGFFFFKRWKTQSKRWRNVAHTLGTVSGELIPITRLPRKRPVDSFEIWLQVCTKYEMEIVSARPERYLELAAYRDTNCQPKVSLALRVIVRHTDAHPRGLTQGRSSLPCWRLRYNLVYNYPRRFRPWPPSKAMPLRYWKTGISHLYNFQELLH